MPECDYCGESFGGEDAYLDHLAADHEGELGAIDRRRVRDHDSSDTEGFSLGPLLLVGLLVLAGGLVVWVTFVMGTGGGGGGGLPDSGDQSVISQVETEESTGNAHVDPGTDIDYERVPPTSGPHYPPGQEASAGFYESEQDLGALVHSIEHGAVVVYYDPAALSDEAEQSMRELANTYTGAWQSFIAVPNPKDDPESAYALTAWERRLTIDEYDEDAVRAFMAEYLGRGPEREVR